MKSKIDIRKLLRGTNKKSGKSHKSFDQGLIGLGVKFNTKGDSK